MAETAPLRLQELEVDANDAGRAGSFSPHADAEIAPHQRDKRERLCRYASRPTVSIESLALTALGQVRYALKTPYRDGDTHIELELLDLVARRTSVGLRARASRAGSEAGDANLTSRAGGLNLPVDARRREFLAAGHPVSSHSLPLRCYLR